MELQGRERELETLAAYVDAVREGPRGFVVEGEPGIGKTTVWEAAVAAARERGHRVLTCRPAGSEVQLSFAALGDLLEDVLDETLGELPRPQRRALEIALLLEDPQGLPPDQRAIGLAVLGAFRFLAASRPVLVAVDDVQWLDGPSAAVLQFALRRLRREPLGVLATLRPGAPEDVLELERALPVERLRLGPLTAASIHRIVRSQLESRCRARSCFACTRRVRAIPSMRSSSCARSTRAESSSRRARSSCFARGSPRCRPECRRCCSSSRCSRIRTCRRVRAVADGADENLEAAVASELLERSGDVVRFRHPLLATTVSARADADAKRRLHRRLADVVHDPEARARHLALAASGPDLEVAAALDDAAHAALARGAPSAAAELLELAIALTPPGRDEDLRRGKLAAAEAHFSSGAISRATAILEELLDELPPGEERAEVLVRLARGTHDLGAALELAERASREAVDDDALLSRVHLLLGSAWPLRGMVSALEDGRLALDHAERSGERRLILDVAARLSLWELWAGRDPTELLARAVALEEPDDDLRGYQSPRMPLALQRMYQGRLGEARTIFEALLAEAVALGDEIAALAVRGRLVDVALRAGEWARAEAHADAAYELAEQIGLEHDGGLTVLWKALVATQLGRVDEARSLAELGERLAAEANQENTRVMNQAVVGLLELSLGNDSAALPALQPLLDWVAEKGLALAHASGRAVRARCARSGGTCRRGLASGRRARVRGPGDPEPVGAGDRDALPRPPRRRATTFSGPRSTTTRMRGGRSSGAERCSRSDACSDARGKRRPRRNRSRARWRSSKSCPLRSGRNARRRSSAASASAARLPAS